MGVGREEGRATTNRLKLSAWCSARGVIQASGSDLAISVGCPSLAPHSKSLCQPTLADLVLRWPAC